MRKSALKSVRPNWKTSHLDKSTLPLKANELSSRWLISLYEESSISMISGGRLLGERFYQFERTVSTSTYEEDARPKSISFDLREVPVESSFAGDLAKKRRMFSNFISL